MTKKLKSVELVDSVCSETSENMQKLKALVRAYSQDPSPANAKYMADVMVEIEDSIKKLRGKLANVVTEIASRD